MLKYNVIVTNEYVMIAENYEGGGGKSFSVRRFFFEDGDYKSIHPDFTITKSFFKSSNDSIHIKTVLENCITLLSSEQKKSLPAWLLWIIISDELKK